jgi:hypothetical protein
MTEIQVVVFGANPLTANSGWYKLLRWKGEPILFYFGSVIDGSNFH